MAKRTNGGTAPEPRKGMPDPRLGEADFRRRFGARFADPAFAGETDAIDRLATIAWQAYRDGRKAPVTRKAGPGFADPDYDLSVDWIAARDAIAAAEARHAASGPRPRPPRQRLAAQRAHLPRRDVQELAPGRDRPLGPRRSAAPRSSSSTCRA